ncbi:hypothetical protein F442_17714 [Phytophthora nicotianae P10297]|uniref:Transcription factor CBF/NF-Y/archaeal histone domain-containing protein n=5 Tax=Phytophthora nicotianae TaxID=4792 RepID=W2QZX0_PHYN3|nr:hypothetical protein PPTG_04249 [Phytophthora nicotianae INRA-310]ETI35889.1 hypothetical protein F443_17859 [Phytophthora nicotianae P1569]ETL82795.1 hypothetical protein L917_17107 [Phytophthora nicotianae]ETO64601.1 hypothetical protein F444_17895 [Phytophthora nicotianae P1976]ETP33830.1 hypothetical protein F442_17714 [Phytophthora nicotianae P10297]KUF80737.1 DNA polymerase epsilon subunit 3 [Phytophthora nicotianae]
MEHEHAASLTARAVKKALPERAILTKDARQTLNSAASMFTLYLASIAHDTSVANKRSTITLKDVLQTLRDADFEHFIEPVEACLQEAKAAASRKKNQKSMVEEEEGGETTNEVAEQLDEVAIDTNEEDGGEDEGMMSVDEPSDAENGGNADEDTEEKGSPDEAMQGEANTEQEPDETTREQKTQDEDDSAEAMEQS